GGDHENEPVIAVQLPPPGGGRDEFAVGFGLHSICFEYRKFWGKPRRKWGDGLGDSSSHLTLPSPPAERVDEPGDGNPTSPCPLPRRRGLMNRETAIPPHPALSP